MGIPPVLVVVVFGEIGVFGGVTTGSFALDGARMSFSETARMRDGSG
jgi:hypothetical protein